MVAKGYEAMNTRLQTYADMYQKLGTIILSKEFQELNSDVIVQDTITAPTEIFLADALQNSAIGVLDLLAGIVNYVSDVVNAAEEAETNENVVE